MNPDRVWAWWRKRREVRELEAAAANAPGPQLIRLHSLRGQVEGMHRAIPEPDRVGPIGEYIRFFEEGLAAEEQAVAEVTRRKEELEAAAAAARVEFEEMHPPFWLLIPAGLLALLAVLPAWLNSVLDLVEKIRG